MFGPISSVVFDCDGTLVDTMSSVIKGLGEAVAHTTNKHPTQEQLLASFGPAPEGVLKKWMSEDLVPQALQYWINFERGLGPEDMTVFDGVPELLEYLKGKNYQLAIFTGRDRESATRIVKAQGWWGKYFSEESMLCGDDGLGTKPQAEPLVTLMKRLQMDPATTLMIGDHEYDAVSGRGAGTKTAAALWDNKESGPTERARFKKLWEKWDKIPVDIRLTSPLSLKQWL